jgi:hypothetical protein
MTQTEFLTWFGQWKDVVTTTVALTAIFVVVIQIRQAGRFERNRLRREQVAARATLPLTLNALSEYGQDMLMALAPLERWLEQGQVGGSPAFVGPRMPAETITAVEKVIAAYPGEDVARALAAVVSEVQVLEARSRDYTSKEDSIRSWSIAMKDNLVMAAGIVARCQDLFEFARKGVEYGEPTRAHLQQVLTWAPIPQHVYPRVWEATKWFADDPKPNWWQRRMLKKITGLFRSA